MFPHNTLLIVAVSIVCVTKSSDFCSLEVERKLEIIAKATNINKLESYVLTELVEGVGSEQSEFWKSLNVSSLSPEVLNWNAKVLLVAQLPHKRTCILIATSQYSVLRLLNPSYDRVYCIILSPVERAGNVRSIVLQPTQSVSIDKFSCDSQQFDSVIVAIEVSTDEKEFSSKFEFDF